MKISEIHKTFKVMMDKNAEAVAFGGCPAFLPQEIDSFLNQAYLQVISNKFTGSNQVSVGFEESVKRIADLEKLIKTDKNITGVFDGTSNTFTINDFFSSNGVYHRMFYVTSVLKFYTNLTSKKIDTDTTDGDSNTKSSTTCIMINHNDARKFLKTYNNDPWIDTPIATIEDNQLTVYVDVHKMTGPFSLDITYVKYPEKIDYKTPDVDITEVPDAVMYEVINRAVVLALENIESQRSQTKLSINSLSE